MTPRTHSRRLGALVAALAAILLVPTVVAAHAELETATPKDGATVEGTPSAISGTYSEAMKTSGSSLILLGPDGKQVAKGGVDPTDDQRMAIDPVPDLAPGTYTVKSTTVSAADGDVDRKSWSFTVVAAPTPTPTLAPSATAPPTATPAPATAAPSPSPAPSAAVTGTSSSGGDVLLPIVAALAIVALGGVLLLNRRGRAG